MLCAAPCVASMIFSACGGEEACTTIGCESDTATANLGPQGTGGSGTAAGISGSGQGFVDPSDNVPGAAGTSSLGEGEACREVVFAAPVAPREAMELLGAEADRVVILWTPPRFHAVGQWYVEFSQVDDDRVIELLRRAAARHL